MESKERRDRLKKIEEREEDIMEIGKRERERGEEKEQ